jgi:uncharacterized protein YdhG (YjbR/CyaY superfamily)
MPPQNFKQGFLHLVFKDPLSYFVYTNLANMDKTKFTSVDEYIATFPEETQKLLEDIRKVIKQTAPKAEEVISYNMPGYKLNGMLVWFAGYKNHIGFYPSGSPMKVFADQLAIYKTSKGAIQFPIDKAIPKKLVKDIVKYRIAENAEKAALKTKATR